MPTRTLSRAALGLLALVALAVLLVSSARLLLGETVLLPGTERSGVRVVDSAAGELSVAVDVRNGGLVPVRVQGPADARLGSYAVRLGRGGPGGGVPEEPGFSPFVLWPGRSRLLVLHLRRDGARALELASFRVSTSVLGLPRELEVRLPTTLRVT